jgi:TetR/AcrR family transcriptional regulator, regulator of cefoperazone and chloramphenicol sensitivity
LFPSIDGTLDWNNPMVSPLEKARKDPDSMKGRILSKARRIFGEYGFHGATTRMIAEEVGIDISTLYYHWGEKGDLYEAVILDMNEDLRQKLLEVENIIHGLPAAERLSISLDLMTDYLFEHPEVSNLILFRYFGKTRDESILDFHVPEVVSGIARSMGLCKDKRNVPDRVRMQVHALMNSIHNFVSGENFFRSMLKISREEYIPMVKETLKFILLPAFTGTRPETVRKKGQGL